MKVSFSFRVYAYCWSLICWHSCLSYGMARWFCCMVSLRWVRISVLVSWVSFAPSAGVPSVWRFSRIGSPIPVWSVNNFWSLNWVFACVAWAMTCV